MEIRDLKIFISVAQNSSISKAAEELHYVQSNVTARIKLLEEQLKAELFYRKSKGVELTASGYLLLDYAQRIVQLSKEAENVIADQEEPRGKLSIGSMETTAAVRLPSLLATYHRAYPHVELNLVTGPSADSIQRLLNFKVDGVFVAGSINRDLFIVEKAFEEELVLVTPLGIEDLRQVKNLTILVFRAGCSYRAQLVRWLQESGKLPYRILEFGSIEGILGCVAAGMGISFLPRSVVETKQPQKNYSWHSISGEFGSMTTWFVRRHNEKISKAMLVFRDLVMNRP
ncbi:LysR family transcriptional regulator [uncultured Desulfuromusa sp.]|uniref:LysR family transcriptional regulator n=1 Tax=uncultured Desulfuromusa sp. TaxID=219183 RepID=UPI002AA61A53|nr:LysR family transcriptional regulator [uncultured Desulfuromusa sp.]